MGLAGILVGEQIVPVAKRLFDRKELATFVTTDCAHHILGQLPTNRKQDA
jgi:xanthosine utilization system XapX-like protein